MAVVPLPTKPSKIKSFSYECFFYTLFYQVNWFFVLMRLFIPSLKIKLPYLCYCVTVKSCYTFIYQEHYLILACTRPLHVSICVVVFIPYIHFFNIEKFFLLLLKEVYFV